jgi:hypothetical protein
MHISFEEFIKLIKEDKLSIDYLKDLILKDGEDAVIDVLNRYGM